MFKYRPKRPRHSSKNANKSKTQRARVEALRAAREAAVVDAAERAEDRYRHRAWRYQERYGVVAGPLLHRLAWLVHNCIAHPVLGVAPSALAVKLHDKTADVLNLADAPTASPLPTVERPLSWLVHNCVAHPLIGLAPRPRWMAWHDTTADDMNERDWI